MKKYLSYGVLLAIILSISLSCSSFTAREDTQPITQPKAIAQAVLPAIQTIPEKRPNSFIRFLKKYKGKLSAILALLWLWFLTRFYEIEKRLHTIKWSIDDLAPPQSHKRQRRPPLERPHPQKKIILLEDLKREL